MQIVLLSFFTLFWSAFVFGFDGMMTRDGFRQLEALHFPIATGQVTHSELKTSQSSKGGTTYQPVINYRFQVGGQMFTGSRLRYLFVTAPDAATASSLIAAHPDGSTIQIYYDPNGPNSSLLFPGVEGPDFLMVLFLTPFNAVMLGFWIWIGGWLRERLFHPVAGGVKIIADKLTTRVRLPQFGALGLGLLATGAMSFVSLLILGVSTKMRPSMGLALTVITAVYLTGAWVFLRRWRKINSGIDDLVIHQSARTLELPMTFDRKERVSARISDIESLTVETIVHTSQKGGVSYTYAPTVQVRGAAPGAYKLADWSDQVKANDFADWLRKQLGL